jgi:hypothetical protein
MTFVPTLMADSDTYNDAQVYQLEELHAAFHSAASVRNNVTGDSQEVMISVSIRFYRFGPKMEY